MNFQRIWRNFPEFPLRPSRREGKEDRTELDVFTVRVYIRSPSRRRLAPAGQREKLGDRCLTSAPTA
jgi:hypothetical protein